MKNIHIILLILCLCSCKPKETQNTDQVYYTCSMDPQIISSKPGNCPICKMELTKVVVDKSEALNSLKISKEQENLAHIKTDKASVTELKNEIALIGTLTADENKRTVLSSPVAGRIVHLYVNTTGKTVTKGTLLYEIYSEELLGVQQEYLWASLKNNEFGGLAETKHMLEAAQTKLLLWGMTQAQINDLIQNDAASGRVKIYCKANGVVSSINISEGTYVMPGMVLFEIADLSTLWVEAQLYAHEMQGIQLQNPVRIQMSAFPGQEWQSKVSFMAPQLETQSKTALIRAEISNPNLLLRPGMQANVWLQQGHKKALSVPQKAIINDPQGTQVWVFNGDRYESRKVTLGLESTDRVEIVSGIIEGDEVVVSGAYLLNSEYVFRKGQK